LAHGCELFQPVRPVTDVIRRFLTHVERKTPDFLAISAILLQSFGTSNFKRHSNELEGWGSPISNPRQTLVQFDKSKNTIQVDQIETLI